MKKVIKTKLCLLMSVLFVIIIGCGEPDEAALAAAKKAKDWKGGEVYSDVGEYMLTIRDVNDNIITFDLSKYRIGGFENATAELKGDTAYFKAKEAASGADIEGYFTIKESAITLTIEKSKFEYISPETVTFAKDNSLMSGTNNNNTENETSEEDDQNASVDQKPTTPSKKYVTVSYSAISNAVIEDLDYYDDGYLKSCDYREKCDICGELGSTTKTWYAHDNASSSTFYCKKCGASGYVKIKAINKWVEVNE